MGFQLQQLGGGERRALLDLAVVAAGRYRVIYRQDGIGKQFFKGGIHQEGEGAAVDEHAVGLGHGDGPDAGIHVDGVGQLAQLAIDYGADNRRGRGGCLVCVGLLLKGL